MNYGNENLLWITKNKYALFKQEVAFVCAILYSANFSFTFYNSNEIIDINRHKIIRKPYLVQQYVADKLQTPFIFIANKN